MYLKHYANNTQYQSSACIEQNEYAAGTDYLIQRNRTSLMTSLEECRSTIWTLSHPQVLPPAMQSV